MREFLLIGIGAALGAYARYWLTTYFAARFGAAFPYGTLFINVTGSFALGFLLVFIGNRLVDDPGYRLLLGTGFLGAYTTFSAFSFDTIALLDGGAAWPAVFNIVASVVGSIAAALLGVLLARMVS